MDLRKSMRSREGAWKWSKGTCIREKNKKLAFVANGVSGNVTEKIPKSVTDGR